MRILFGIVGLLALVGCALSPVDDELKDLGDFGLGHNVVIAPNPHMGPGSREMETPSSFIRSQAPYMSGTDTARCPKPLPRS